MKYLTADIIVGKYHDEIPCLSELDFDELEEYIIEKFTGCEFTAYGVFDDSDEYVVGICLVRAFNASKELTDTFISELPEKIEEAKEKFKNKFGVEAVVYLCPSFSP